MVALMVDRVCHCGEEFSAKPSDIKRGWGDSCGKRCAAIKREADKKAAESDRAIIYMVDVSQTTSAVSENKASKCFRTYEVDRENWGIMKNGTISCSWYNNVIRLDTGEESESLIVNSATVNKFFFLDRAKALAFLHVADRAAYALVMSWPEIAKMIPSDNGRCFSTTTTEVFYEQQCLANPKMKLWESTMEYPAETFTAEQVIAETKEQRKLSEKPLRVVKVTITAETVEVFE